MSVELRGPKNSICGDGELCSWSEDGDVMRISYNVFVVRVVGNGWFACVASCLLEWGDGALGGCDVSVPLRRIGVIGEIDSVSWLYSALDAIEVICSIIWCGFQVIWGNGHYLWFPRFWLDFHHFRYGSSLFPCSHSDNALSNAAEWALRWMEGGVAGVCGTKRGHVPLGDHLK